MPNPLSALSIAVVLVTIAAVLFWPERGLIPRWQQAHRLTARVLSEDALKHIYKSELKQRRPTIESLAGALHITVSLATDILSQLAAREMLQFEQGEFGLTFAGRDYALHIIRAHRLWERHLAENTGLTEAEWHNQAERLEHTLSPVQANVLAAQLGHPTHDPHGDPIPTASGKLVAHGGQPLIAMSNDVPLQIVHLEDEPDMLYAQLVAEGLHPGMQVRLAEITPQRVRFWSNAGEHVLAPMVAANISVVALPQMRMTRPALRESLADVRPGENAIVQAILPACRGSERRRFLDLGILPGTHIKAELGSPSGDPTAYRIRGALIALRREQARYIIITRPQETSTLEMST